MMSQIAYFGLGEIDYERYWLIEYDGDPSFSEVINYPERFQAERHADKIAEANGWDIDDMTTVEISRLEFFKREGVEV